MGCNVHDVFFKIVVYRKKKHKKFKSIFYYDLKLLSFLKTKY
jgi:hypothetical protein